MLFVLLIISMLLAIYLLVKKMKNFSYLCWFIVIYWIFNIVICVIVFNKYDWNYIGLIWIMLACITFVLVYDFVYSKIKIAPIKDIKTTDVSDKHSDIFLLISIGLALIYVNMLVNSFGFKITSLLNFKELVELNKVASNIRYSGEENHPIYMQILLVFVYASVMIGGYSKVYAKRKFSIILSFVSLIPILLILLIENTKASLISGVLLWCGGWLVAHLERDKRLPKVNVKKLLFIFGVGICFLFLLLLSMMLRIGTFDFSTVKVVFYKFFNYAFGHMAAFDYWFRNNFKSIDLTFGQYTFFGIFNSLGIAQRMIGVYQEKLTVGIIDTNVYTSNRGVITDFGVFGGLIFYALLGFLAAVAYKRVMQSDRKHEISITILLGIFAFIAYVFVSIFSYMSFILAFGIFYLYLIYKNKGFEVIKSFRKKGANAIETEV